VAIQPIDLQTLYSQLEKIGKTQIQQQAAAQAARDSEIQANRNDAEQKMKTVQQTDAGDEKVGMVHERDGSSGSKSSPEGSGGKKTEKNEEIAEPEKEIIRDPALGSHIDISG
jgi:hypothetical protein